MSDPKPFASLSSGLLARKGAARPAMKPQGFGQMGGGNLEDDLGWNDMGFEPPKAAPAPRDASHDAFGEAVEEHPRVHPTGLTPIHSPVHTQQAELADRLGVDEEDEEFDETAELYDADAPDSPEPDEAVEDPGETDAFELTDTYEPAPAFEPIAVAEPSPAFEPTPTVEEVEVPAPAVVAAPARTPISRTVSGGKSKAAFTLRLDPDRHLKLRLACAVNGRSAQQIVTAAVDRLLREMPELDAMAEKAKRKG